MKLYHLVSLLSLPFLCSSVAVPVHNMYDEATMSSAKLVLQSLSGGNEQAKLLNLFEDAVAALKQGAGSSEPAEPVSEEEELKQGKRFIQYDADQKPQWMSQQEIKETLFDKKKKYMDITDYRDLYDDFSESSLTGDGNPFLKDIPTSLEHEEAVLAMFAGISKSMVKKRLTRFTSFFNRYYTSKTGRESAEWLYERIASTIAMHNMAQHRNPTQKEQPISVKFVNHTWGQPSIIATIPGNSLDPVEREKVVVVGAHLDDTGGFFGQYLRAPGADDDGSGAMTTLEAFRVLVGSNFRPKRTLEFHWYSAEEQGLFGSQAVATEYFRKARPVVGMLQMDMTGYFDPAGGHQEHIGLVTDFVSKELTGFIGKLVDRFCDIPFKETTCGYACSDHASWSKVGYQSAFPFESKFDITSPYIHSADDTVDHINFDHLIQYVKLAIAYAVEMAGRT